jgi:ABC-2 type transport system permease protein
MNITTIAGRELRSLFLSPLAWTILAVVQLILAYLFLSQIDFYLTIQPKIAAIEGAPGVTDLVIAPLFGNAAVILLLITPLLTMRLISEERRNQTLSLLFSAPLSMTEIILGKYLGIMTFMLIMIGLLALMPLSLMAGATLDYGKLAACILALILLMGAFSAVGLYMSTIASQPAIAAIGSFGLLLLLWIVDWAGSNSDKSSELFASLSLLHHFENLLKGLVHSADIAYYLLFIALFITLSIRHLDNDRLQK